MKSHCMKKMVAVILLTFLLLVYSTTALPYTYEIGNTTVVSGMDFFPIEFYVMFLILGIIFMIIGLVSYYDWVFEMFATLFLLICAFGTPLAASYNIDVSYNTSNITQYVVTPVVNTVLPVFFVYITYGLSVLTFFLFVIFLYRRAMEWLSIKDKKYEDEFL